MLGARGISLRGLGPSPIAISNFAATTRAVPDNGLLEKLPKAILSYDGTVRRSSVARHHHPNKN